jgi:hypothetical protein
MKLSKDKKAVLAKKLTDIAANVAKKPVFVVTHNELEYNILDYYTKKSIFTGIPSKGLARFLCDQLNKSKSKPHISAMQHYINVYSKHYYDCIFYKNTIKTTKDLYKKHVTITRLDISIEHLKMAVSQLRKSC